MRNSGWAKATLTVGAVLVAAAEVVHWRASRDAVRAPRYGLPDSGAAHSEVIVVLGFPSFRSGRMHPLQKWRTEIAVRSMNPAAMSTLVFTGAGRPGGKSEAAVMAGYAQHELGIAPDHIVLEEHATTTWQNIRNSMQYLRGADVVKIASDPTHARKGRRYLFLQSPVVGAKLRRTDDYRVGERWWLKIPMLGYAMSAGRRRRPASVGEDPRPAGADITPDR
ncbi:YdcF family protein [Spelaeicoccus albus]|uniref:Uncharacterized SAM-binding protein YcdF (DUF218 family) n=1 Tax=Spelaeicoccus albus TaxID=1280376 RepID=A0A7Z0D387_9MICO|nr:YdcF family protein [Spelaeicoccus albus]NYI68054.1 uncharacterized SAM-binding protein YcdF (DUF218 family) [Spelaeicoccus albus]